MINLNREQREKIVKDMEWSVHPDAGYLQTNDTRKMIRQSRRHLKAWLEQGKLCPEIITYFKELKDDEKESNKEVKEYLEKLRENE